MSNAIEIVLNLETFVDPFPGQADTDVIFVQCTRCGGSGHFVCYEVVNGGLCFECHGTRGQQVLVGTLRKREKGRVSRRNTELRKTLKAQEAHNERMAAYEAQYPELATWSEQISDDEFLMDLWGKAFKWDLSEKQVAAAAAAITRKVTRAAERAEAKANAAPAPVGKVTVTGTVKTVKYQENDFGGAWKMVVEGEGGFKVWSTVPSKIIDAVMEEQSARDTTADEEFVGWSELLKGRSITFTATLEASRDDASFAFAKRPTKATIA